MYSFCFCFFFCRSSSTFTNFNLQSTIFDGKLNRFEDDQNNRDRKKKTVFVTAATLALNILPATRKNGLQNQTTSNQIGYALTVENNQI